MCDISDQEGRDLNVITWLLLHQGGGIAIGKGKESSPSLALHPPKMVVAARRWSLVACLLLCAACSLTIGASVRDVENTLIPLERDHTTARTRQRSPDAGTASSSSASSPSSADATTGAEAASASSPSTAEKGDDKSSVENAFDMSDSEENELAEAFSFEKLEPDAEKAEERSVAKQQRRLEKARKASAPDFARETGDVLLDNFGVSIQDPSKVKDASQPSGPSAATNTSVMIAGTTPPHTRIDQPFEKEIVKSRSDDRRYRRFRMTNGLDVLVVQDMTSTKSAAAMDVNVGYWKDPADISGLAHFLEHMLFLGTKKFPQEDAYSSFLAAHGGAANAFTSMLNTNYYFDVGPRALFGALERFAGFFTNPTMSESSTEREVRAVESEHMKNLQNDAWRTFQLIQSFAREDCPFHKFGTGSSGTLGSVPKAKLRAELLKFWKEHYVAKNLRLVVIGRHSLSTLEKWVRMIFKDIPTGSGAAPFKPQPYPVEDKHNEVFPAGFLPSTVHLQTVKDSKNLLLLWTLPPQVVNYGYKDMEYVASLLGNEGVGSLLSTLKYRGWATALSAGPDLSTGRFDLFQVDIDLTRRGMHADAIREIIALVFQEIRLIATEGVDYWRWHEMGTMSAISFRMKNKEVAMSYASALAADMAKFAPRDLLMANYMYMSFDEKGIRSILDELTPARVLVMVSAKEHDINLPSSEKWYGTKYNLAKVSDSDFQYWNASRFEPPPPPPSMVVLMLLLCAILCIRLSLVAAVALPGLET